MLSIVPVFGGSFFTLPYLAMAFFCTLGVVVGISFFRSITIPMPGVKCPWHLEHGKVTWVIPGKNCPQCGTPCE